MKFYLLVFALFITIFSQSMTFASSNEIPQTYFHSNQDVQVQINSVQKWRNDSFIFPNDQIGLYNPQVVMDKEQNMYVVANGVNSSTIGWNYLFYTMFSYENKTWSTPVAFVLYKNSEMHADSVRIALDDLYTLHIVWQGNPYSTSSPTKSYYQSFNYSSGVWSDLFDLSTMKSPSTAIARDPFIAIDMNNDPHIVWQDHSGTYSYTSGNIYHVAFDHITKTMSLVEDLTNSDSLQSTYPTIAFDDANNLHLIWAEEASLVGNNYNLMYKKYNNALQLWDDAIVLSNGGSGWLSPPQIAVDKDQNIVVVWEDYDAQNIGSGNDRDLFLVCFDNSTSTWNNAVLISENSTYPSNYPNIAIDGYKNTYIVWSEYSGNPGQYDVWYRSYNYDNNSFTPLEILSNNKTTQLPPLPIVFVDNSDFPHVFWSDYPVNTYPGYITAVSHHYQGDPPTATQLKVLSNSPSNGEVQLVWESIEHTYEYLLYRSQNNFSTIANIPLLTTLQTTSFSEQVTANGTYYYGVISSNTIGTSGLSNIVKVEVSIPPQKEDTTSSSSTSSSSSSTTDKSSSLSSSPVDTSQSNTDISIAGSYDLILVLGMALLTCSKLLARVFKSNKLR